MKLFYCVKFELKNILKMKLTYIFLFFTLVYNWYIYNSALAESNSLDFIRSTAYCSQGLIFAFILLGIYLCKKETDSNMIEVIKGINLAVFTKFSSKFITIIVLVLILTLTNLFLILFLFKSNYSNYLQDIIVYLFIYWFCALIIGALIGFIIAHLCKSKSVYIFSLLAWFFITPINNLLFTQLGILGFNKAFDVANFFNICQDNIYNSIHETYGLSIENYQIYQRLFLISVLLFIIFIIFHKKKLQTKRTFIISISIISFIIILTGFKTFEDNQVMTYDLEEDAFINRDYLDYDDILSKKSYSKNFKATKYNIDLDINENLKGAVKINLENISDKSQKEIHFLLYHGLKVKDILANGKEVTFIQDFDNINISLENELEKNHSMEIEIKYAGSTSPKNYANSRAIYLTNTFPFIPVLSEHSSIMSDGILDSNIYRHNIYLDSNIEYSLNLNNDEAIYTNLEKVNKNQWKGKSDNGIFLIKGVQVEDNIGSLNVLYPTKLEGKKDILEEKIKTIKKSIDLINTYFNLNIKLENLMIMDTTYIVYETFPSNKGFYNDGTLILPLRDFEKDEYLSSLVSSTTWKNIGVDDSNFQALRVFDLATGMYFQNKLLGNYENNDFEIYIDNLKMNKDLFESENIKLFDYIEPSEKIFNFIKDTEINNNTKINFLKDWFYDISKNNIRDIKEISKRIK